jgi:stearoyl-CoA 9-desaturase NADPH oxidoreductase
VLEDLDRRHEGMLLDLRLTSERGRLEPSDLDDVCPDWREREAFCSGPGEMLDALIEHWESNGDPDRLHFERFQPKIGGEGAEGEGGAVSAFLTAKRPSNAMAARRFWRLACRPA